MELNVSRFESVDNLPDLVLPAIQDINNKDGSLTTIAIRARTKTRKLHESMSKVLQIDQL
jgi:hypothetical protein